MTINKRQSLLDKAAAYAKLAAEAKLTEQASKSANAVRMSPQKEPQSEPAPQSGKPEARCLLNLPLIATKDEPVAPQAMTLTDEQQQAIALASQGKEFCLIGAAGTGKTTTVKTMIAELLASNLIGPLKHSTKRLAAGDPAIAFVSFTNRAVNNIRKQLPKHLKHLALTCHKLLEYEPVKTKTQDDEGNWKTTMTFEPKITSMNPFYGLQLIVVEEASMVAVPLFQQLVNGFPNARFIFLGDIFQLPPVYETGILGYKMVELPVVELTKVWRQGLDSGIISLAHAVKEGKSLNQSALEKFAEIKQDIILKPWPKKVTPDAAMRAFANHIRNQLVNEFDPLVDIMLCPFNKAFGSIEINKVMAQVFGEQRGATVYEIRGGMHKHYLAVGDKVMYDKEDYLIVNIARNGNYIGPDPLAESEHLDRWGMYSGKFKSTASKAVATDEEMEHAFSGLAGISLDSDDDIDASKRAASHIVTIQSLLEDESGQKIVIDLDTTGDMNKLDLSYCISVHKSQGSEWNKVYLVLHNSHASMISRELLYTAITRARKEIIIYYEKDASPIGGTGTFPKAAKNVIVKGNTLAQKAEYFKGKKSERERKLSLEEILTKTAEALENDIS